MAKSKLLENSIEIWDIELKEHLFFKLEPYFHILSNEEKQRYHNFKVDGRRKLYIITWITLRLLLSKYINKKPEQIIFYKNKYGKPFIKASSLKFNISHSKEKLVVAISECEVGVDIEYIDINFDIDDIMGIVLSENEKSFIKTLKPELQRKQFFLYWTQKEALLKAIGTGINIDLNTLEINSSTAVNNNYKILRFKEWSILPLQTLDLKYVGHIAYKYNVSKTLKYFYNIDFYNLEIFKNKFFLPPASVIRVKKK